MEPSTPGSLKLALYRSRLTSTLKVCIQISLRRLLACRCVTDGIEWAYVARQLESSRILVAAVMRSSRPTQPDTAPLADRGNIISPAIWHAYLTPRSRIQIRSGSCQPAINTPGDDGRWVHATDAGTPKHDLDSSYAGAMIHEVRCQNIYRTCAALTLQHKIRLRTEMKMSSQRSTLGVYLGARVTKHRRVFLIQLTCRMPSCLVLSSACSLASANHIGSGEIWRGSIGYRYHLEREQVYHSLDTACRVSMYIWIRLWHGFHGMAYAAAVRSRMDMWHRIR